MPVKVWSRGQCLPVWQPGGMRKRAHPDFGKSISGEWLPVQVPDGRGYCMMIAAGIGSLYPARGQTKEVTGKVAESMAFRIIFPYKGICTAHKAGKSPYMRR